MNEKRKLALFLGTLPKLSSKKALYFLKKHDSLSSLQADQIALNEIPEIKKQILHFEKTIYFESQIWLEKPHHHLICIQDPQYPSLLQEIPDPPVTLFVAGDLTTLQQDQIAVVGSRHPSQRGLENAYEFSHQIAQNKVHITSGLAMGIDGAAHQGALHAGGKTLAILGTGLNHIYPAIHKNLAAKIAEQGALISEFSLSTPPRPFHFPKRNRLISGLSLGILVVEATRQSGSLITARLALEYNRDIFAIPGSIHNPLSKGCHDLLKQGAKLVEKAEDILEDYPTLKNKIAPKNKATKIKTLDKFSLIDFIAEETTSFDYIQKCSKQDPAVLKTALIDLVCAGFIAEVPGGYLKLLDPNIKY